MSAIRVEALCKDLEAIKEDCLGNGPKEAVRKPRDDFFGAKEIVRFFSFSLPVLFVLKWIGIGCRSPTA